MQSQQFKTGCADNEEIFKCIGAAGRRYKLSLSEKSGVDESPSSYQQQYPPGSAECLAKYCTDKDFLDQVENACFIDLALMNDKKTLMNMKNETVKNMTIDCMVDKIGRLAVKDIKNNIDQKNN